MNKSQKRPSINVEKRDVSGKKGENLGKKRLPLNIYGKETKSISLKGMPLNSKNFLINMEKQLG